MFDFLLDAANIRYVPHETISEKLAVGTEVTLRGMGTVFAVLVLIWILVEFLHLLLGVKAPKAENKEAAPVAPVTETVTESPAVAEVPAMADDLALIAVITAAVAAANGSSPNSFRVVSFKRANNKFSQGR